jgi:hypothetical protein
MYVALRETKPSLNLSCPSRVCRVEDRPVSLYRVAGVCLSRHHQQGSDKQRPPAGFARDCRGKALLSVERRQQILEVDQYRLHLNDEHGPRRWQPREHIDRSAFAADAKRVLGQGDPAKGHQPRDDLANDRCMLLVE